MQNKTSPLILTFGAADPTGAIGIQADIASFAAMGCLGVSAVTTILVGDTARVEDAQPIDPEWVADQARLVLEDMSVAAFKIGAPGSVENVTAIAEIVSDYPDVPLVLDPFGAPSVGALESDDMAAAIRELLVPQTTLLVLSAGELAQLAETWREPANTDMSEADVAHLIQAGCEYVLVTGMPCGVQEVATALFDDSGIVRQDVWPRIAGSFAGAGATLSGAAAAMLANGLDVPEAVAEAQEFTLAALSNAQRPGMGRLLPDRFFWAREDAADDE